ncbi:helix-turn-helix domain-containing protein [Nonomuraea sp. NPDC003804]|uniref:helix-turn-helix domain-containing protein n=1 Tax=Nonomuraea sp. NPDC003804 TaxID=3154547 RepID=UPI00339F90C5
MAFAPGGGLTVFEENGPAAVARHLHPVWKVVLPERGTAVAGRVRGAGLLVPPQLAHTAAVTSAYTALFVDPWLLGAPREVTALDGHAVRRLRDALTRGAALPELVALAGPAPALDPRVAHALALATTSPPAAAPGPRVHTATTAPGLPVHTADAVAPGLPVHAMAAVPPGLPVHAITADLGLPVHAMAADSPELPIHAIAAEVGLSVPRLRALVRASVGIPLVRLRQWARLRAAVAQLACSSVASAAATAGFADQAHLARTARAMLGRTPVSLSTHPVPGRPASPSPGLPDPTPTGSPAASDPTPTGSPAVPDAIPTRPPAVPDPTPTRPPAAPDPTPTRPPAVSDLASSPSPREAPGAAARSR